MGKEFYVDYTYECWKCPEKHEGRATIVADSADEAQAAFTEEFREWPGLDGFEYDTKVTGVSWRV